MLKTDLVLSCHYQRCIEQDCQRCPSSRVTFDQRAIRLHWARGNATAFTPITKVPPNVNPFSGKLFNYQYGDRQILYAQFHQLTTNLDNADKNAFPPLSK
jgi:hypothetical protein